MKKNEFTTDSMTLAVTLALYGYKPNIEMNTARRASFIFETSAALEELVRRYGLNDEDGLLVTPRLLFAEWTNMRARVNDLQRS